VDDFGWNYLTAEDKEQILCGIRDGRAYAGPFHVELYPADRCNIECFFCSTAAIRGTDEIPMPRLEELVTELGTLGTRSIRLAGGGEPLFHRRIAELLERIATTPMRIENVTTNGVLLGDRVRDVLLRTCDTLTISLNTADPKSYASMMQTPERNFGRVVENVKTLVAHRAAARSRKPEVNVQFLVWKENFRTIPAMYDLARDMGADGIIFNGLAYLRDDQKMSEQETAEMMALYKALVRTDEYRKIRAIDSFERDISLLVAEINDDLTRQRHARGPIGRLVHLLTRRDFTLREKLEHRRRMGELQRIAAARASLPDDCTIAWHSLVVRTSGAVAPCCILQGKQLGNVFQSSVRDVWYGEPYQRFRSELTQILREAADWKHDGDPSRTVEPLCGSRSGERCPVKGYYTTDVPFSRALADARRLLLERSV
jgi:MoaA/NifB/PqqE/SkfB family radical SAM enzyme